MLMKVEPRVTVRLLRNQRAKNCAGVVAAVTGPSAVWKYCCRPVSRAR
jgi:hypothetical protein